MKLAIFLLVAVDLFTYCLTKAQQPALVDAKTTAETKDLWISLHRLAGKQILFGHQHAMEYGHGWVGEPDMSDVKKVTGIAGNPDKITWYAAAGGALITSAFCNAPLK
jgi:mannan endo-1,4-beta-mannosidase